MRRKGQSLAEVVQIVGLIILVLVFGGFGLYTSYHRYFTGTNAETRTAIAMEHTAFQLSRIANSLERQERLNLTKPASLTYDNR